MRPGLGRLPEGRLRGFPNPPILGPTSFLKDGGLVGRGAFGVTDFKRASVGEYAERSITAATTQSRTDVARGRATNPFAVALCSLSEFGGGPLVSFGLFEAPGAGCPRIGFQEATIY